MCLLGALQSGSCSTVRARSSRSARCPLGHREATAVIARDASKANKELRAASEKRGRGFLELV
jgi:hypothetical protein